MCIYYVVMIQTFDVWLPKTNIGNVIIMNTKYTLRNITKWRNPSIVQSNQINLCQLVYYDPIHNRYITLKYIYLEKVLQQHIRIKTEGCHKVNPIERRFKKCWNGWSNNESIMKKTNDNASICFIVILIAVVIRLFFTCSLGYFLYGCIKLLTVS